MDGHPEPIYMPDLWQYDWHKEWVDKEFTIPGL